MPDPAPISCRIDLEINPLRVARPSHATSLGSDDAPAKVIQLGSQCRCEACPRVVLLIGKLIDFPGDMLCDVKRDVALVAPLPLLWDAIEQEVGDLAQSCNDCQPCQTPVVRPLSELGNTWLRLQVRGAEDRSPHPSRRCQPAI